MSPLKSTASYPSTAASLLGFPASNLSRHTFLSFTFSLLYCILFMQQQSLLADAARMKCVACDLAKCGTPPDNCPLGTVRDSCDCCLICGRLKGEFCGGEFNFYGRCGRGLRCHMHSPNSVYGMCVVDTSATSNNIDNNIDNNNNNNNDNYNNKTSYDTKLPSAKRTDQTNNNQKYDDAKLQELGLPPQPYADVAVAVKYQQKDGSHGNGDAKTTVMPPPQMDDPRSGGEYNQQKGVATFNYATCAPECTVSYCYGNPRALCSARRQQDMHSCKDPCATTVCRACETPFDPSLSCVLCPYEQKSIDEKKYADCIKDFGRCVKKRSHGKNLDMLQMKLLDSRFHCEVPTC